MSYGAYLRTCALEFLLCAVMALGLGLNVVQAFHIPQEEAANVALVLVATMVPLACCFLAGYSKRSLLIGVPLIVVSIAVYLFALSQITPTALFVEGYENRALVFIVLLPLSFIVYLFARTRLGLIIAFVAGGVTCGAIQFLYDMNLVVPTVAYLAACATLYVLKSSPVPLQPSSFSNEGSAVRGGRGTISTHASSEGTSNVTSSFARALGSDAASRIPRAVMALGLVAASALLSVGLFALVIAPLNPPAHELKLITEYYSLEEVHVSGLLAFLHQRNDQLSSSNESNESQYSDMLDEKSQDAEGGADSQQEGDDDRLGDGSYDATTAGDPLSIVRYLQEHWWVGFIALVLIVLAWMLVVAVRRHMRKRRLERWRSLGARAEYLAAFDHVCTTLERARLINRGSKTPHELAASTDQLAVTLERWPIGSQANAAYDAAAEEAPRAKTAVDDTREDSAVTGSALMHSGEGSKAICYASSQFGRLAECFARVSYGGEQPSASEISSLESYVELMPKRLPRAIGRLRYLGHFFRV